ncbi:MAG: signal peptidase I [Candidatus Aenigmarchaeota archaeon]|nr:signal peptidase I [Candidatus Aenigmarchaeota archaeon]
MAKERKQKTIARELIEIVVVIAVAYIFYFGMGIALGTSTPMFSVVSESMEPTLHIGDMVIVQVEKTYNVGDIVVYMRGNIPIIHRIIEKNSEGYIIKGDNNKTNPIPDPGIVKENQIIGKAIVTFPVLGAPRYFLYKIGI